MNEPDNNNKPDTNPLTGKPFAFYKKGMALSELVHGADIKPATAAEARDKFLAWIMTKPEAERDAILYAADKLFDLVAGKEHMLNAFALANAELAALHEEGLLTTAIVVPEGLRKPWHNADEGVYGPEYQGQPETAIKVPT